MLTKAQLKIQRSGIGGSDIAAIAGVSPWKSALAAYAEKVGQIPPHEETEATYWGSALESKIAERYRRDRRVRLTKPSFVFHNAAPWAIALPDRFVRDTALDQIQRGLEIKAPGGRQADRWGEADDAVPIEYLTQCQWYCEVCDLPAWDVAVLIGGQDYREYHLERDRAIGERLLDIGRAFWFDHVKAGKPPDPDASESAREALSHLYPRNVRPELAQASSAAMTWAERLKSARQAIANAKGEADLCENLLKAVIQDADGIALPDGEKITWRKSKDSEIVSWAEAAEEIGAELTAALSVHYGSEEGRARSIELREKIVKAWTTTKPGSRRFVVPRSWSKEDAE